MKRFTAMLLICFTLFALASCSEKVPAATPTPVSTSTPVPSVPESNLEKVSKIEILDSINYILAEPIEFRGFENFSDEQKEVIAIMRLDAGKESVFKGNCLVETDVNTGEVVIYCGDWQNPGMDPDFIKPDFGTLRMVASKKTEFVAKYSDVTMDNAKTYATTLRTAGYTADSVEFDLVSIGEDTYSFSGTNGSGVFVEVLYSAGYLRVTLKAAQ